MCAKAQACAADAYPCAPLPQARRQDPTPHACPTHPLAGSAAGKALPRQQTEHANMSPGAVTGSGTCERSEAAAPQEGDDQDVEAADSACSSECGAGLSEGGAPDNGVASSQVLELQPKDFFSDDLSRPSSLSPPSLANSFLGLERSRELGAGVKELAKAEQPTGRPEEGERGMEVGKMCTEKVNLPSGGRGSSCTAITERGERTAEDRGEGGGRDEWTAEDRKKVGLASRPKGKETLTPSKIQVWFTPHSPAQPSPFPPSLFLPPPPSPRTPSPPWFLLSPCVPQLRVSADAAAIAVVLIVSPLCVLALPRYPPTPSNSN